MNREKLNVKDLINVGLFTVLIFIFTFIGGMIGFIPMLMPIVPFVAGILSGSVCMLFATKIRKAGMFFIEQMIIALAFAVTGHGFFILITACVAGILGELVLRKGEYKSIKCARWAFVVGTLAGVGNWIPIFFARDAYIESMIEMGYGKEFADTMMSVLPDWSLLPIIILGMVGMYIGCTIGIIMLKKHFIKAGMINGGVVLEQD